MNSEGQGLHTFDPFSKSRTQPAPGGGPRYQAELEGIAYVIRDLLNGGLVLHRTLDVPERFRSERRVLRRIAELEAQAGT